MIVWFELATTDVDGAQAFYEAISAWTIEPSGMPGMDYRLAKVGDRQVAGVMPLMMEQAPCWRGYIGVDDVDAMAGRGAAAGGMVHFGAHDIPSVGRFAVCPGMAGA